MFQGAHFRLDPLATATATSTSTQAKAVHRQQATSSNTFGPGETCCKICPSGQTKRRQKVCSTTNKFFANSTQSKLLIAIATLRLTISAISSYSTSSLSTLLKLLILGCYYVLAFISLLLILIVYINHVTNQQYQSAHKQTVAMNRIPESLSMELRPTSGREALPYLKVLSLPQIRTKRSISRQSFLLDETNINQFESERKSILKPLKSGEKLLNSELNEFSFTAKKAQESFKGQQSSGPNNDREFREGKRHRAGKVFLPTEGADTRDSRQLAESGQISLNNRGSISASNSQMTSNATTLQRISYPQQQKLDWRQENQWVPIVESRRQNGFAASLKSADNFNGVIMRPQQNQVKNSNLDSNAQLLNSRKAPVTATSLTLPATIRNHISIAVAPSTIDIIEATFPIENQNFYAYHRGQPSVSTMHERNSRQWRKPKLQHNGFAPRKMVNKFYRKVLLCDKTLVSLEYVKRVEAELRRPPQYYYDDFNQIEIEGSNLNPVLIAKPRISVPSTTTLNATINYMLPSESENRDLILDRSGYRNKNHNLLSDEDPLVKCDMWDLEKGLKNRKPPMEILRQAIRTDFDTVRDAINRCRQLSEKNLPRDDEFHDGLEIPISSEDLLSIFSMKRGLLPGTKWCGLGDQASSYNDLGSKHRIDICCRAHDHCPIRLKPFRNDYGVLNIALYTKSHCDCDADFYRCLREVHSRTADMLGNLYFNVMKLQCMREERMKVCRAMKPLALGFERCVRYEESPYKTVFKFTTPPVSY